MVVASRNDAQGRAPGGTGVSSISTAMIVLVVVLSVFCLTALALHLVKGAADGYLKVKFGPFLFEYGARPKMSPDEPVVDKKQSESGEDLPPGSC
jgi:hypothetical protein